MVKTALITGITGQDGSYLTELLRGKGYQVYGLVRRLGSANLSRIAHPAHQLQLVKGALTDESSLSVAVQAAQPDEVYNLAADTRVAASWDQPALAGDVTGLGFARLLEAVRRFGRSARVFQASSCEVFGAAEETPQNEQTRFLPRNPYACAKVYAHHMGVLYRESHGMFISIGILYNHDSPRRGTEVVTRKITNGIARIRSGLAKELRLGNLDARRDWGYAGDYVKAMWLTLQQDRPDDYVIATGRSHSVGELAELAFRQVGLNWKDHVVVDKGLFRPAEAHRLCGDASKARRGLGWEAETTLEQLVSMMVEADLERVAKAMSAPQT